ncbi:MAG: hypothetical protein WDA02_05830 [Saccharofermentanales bacterium]
MDISQIDLELNVKIREVFKEILKKTNVNIIFDDIDLNSDIVESTKINNNEHNFCIQKIRYKLSDNIINDKYYKYINNKIKKNISKLNYNDKINYLYKKPFYLKIFKLLYGDLIIKNKKYYFIYQITYNSITLDLTKVEYERFLYYTKYVFKLKQILNLNKELDIDQTFKIVFDDDKAAKEMYNDLYSNFSDIIKPFENDDNKNIDDMDD